MKSGVPVAAVFVVKARTKVCVTNGCSELRIIGSFLNPSENPHGKDQKMRPVTTKAGTLISGSREKILWRPERKLVPQNTRKHVTDTELQGFRVKRAQKGLYLTTPCFLRGRCFELQKCSLNHGIFVRMFSRFALVSELKEPWASGRVLKHSDSSSRSDLLTAACPST